ncbi:hypothetical protein FGIG_06392 [Fasciola gigantica]|uniref:Uncharacterized protein n=1 Tax=Fasciola gigantica TaxID=46835 RepID=A0A504YI79_FASGI|nr:hypothetical protein FGIG_06392 [Fasciola gigantica]
MFVYDKDLRQPMMDMRSVLDHTQTPAQSNVQFTDFSPNGSTILTNSSVTNRYDPVNNSIKLNPDKLTQSQPLFPLLPPFVYPVNSWLQQFSPTAPLQETLGRIYQSFFGLFERQLSQRLEQFSTRLDNFQREQTFTKTQVSRLERIVQTRLVTPVLTEDGEKSISEMNGVSDETNSNHLSTGWYDVPSTNMWTKASTSSPINSESVRLLIRPETSTIHTNSVSSEVPSAASLPDLTRLHLERNLFYSPPITNTTAATTITQTGLRELNSLTRLGSPNMSATLNHVTNTLFHSSIQSHLFWNQWTSDWIRANSGLTGRCSTTTTATDNNNNTKNNNNNSVISSRSNNNYTEDRGNNSTANSFTALLEKIRASGATITDSRMKTTGRDEYSNDKDSIYE